MADLFQPTLHGLRPKAAPSLLGEAVHLTLESSPLSMDDVFARLSLAEARSLGAELIAAADEAQAIRARKGHALQPAERVPA